MRPRDTVATERALARVLSAGTLFSSACLALGLGAWLVAPGGRGEHALFTIGLVALMCTPVARVAVSVLEFARHREWWLVLWTLVVLVLLVGGLIVALAV